MIEKNLDEVTTLDVILEVIPQSALTFLSPTEGVSMSAANFAAERIKETVNVISKRIESTASAAETLNYGGKDIELNRPAKINFEDDILLMGKLYGLSAWLREAIKAKKIGLETFANATSSKVFYQEPFEEIIIPNITYPCFVPFTMDDAIGEMSVVDRANYYALEAMAAHIGKYIHGSGKLANVRNSLLNFQITRFETKMTSGGETDFPVSRLKVYTVEEINAVFNTLMNKHREVEEKLNWYKAKLENRVSVATAELERQRVLDIRQEEDRFNTANDEYKSALNRIKLKNQAWLSQASAILSESKKHFASFKIVIPHSLSETYEIVKLKEE
jgi:hypothetical protein